MAGSRAVILSPTRELALQTAKVVKELARYMNLRSAILVGGDSMEAQFAELAANPDIIVATPGEAFWLKLPARSTSDMKSNYFIDSACDGSYEQLSLSFLHEERMEVSTAF